MMLRFTITGLCVFTFAVLPLQAQHMRGGSGASHVGGGGGSWHAGSAGARGGHYSGGASQPLGNAGGSYGGVAMYPRSARGNAAPGGAESERPATNYYTSHDPTPRAGWQALYPGGSDIRFTADMLPPNARGYSPAPRESVTAIAPTGAGTSARRLRSQWIAREGFNDRDRFSHHFREDDDRGFGEPFCDSSFGFCGSPYFYEFYGAGFGCIGGSYWDASNWEGAPAMLNLSPCFASSYATDEDQTSPDDSPYPSDYWPAPVNSPADAGFSPDISSPGVAQENASPAPVSADQRPVTLLQLKDGSMYGLTQYWVAGGLLNYITDYGARNAVPFDRIDMAKTVQLNSQRGIPFILQTNSPSH